VISTDAVVGNPATEETTVNEEADPKSKDDDDASQNDEAESSPSETTGPAAPPWGIKVLRVLIFTFLGTFFTGLLFADGIPNGLRVEFDLLASFKLGLIAGVVAALIRTVVAMLPVFVDDNVGRKRES
jgi:hypothetical protein